MKSAGVMIGWNENLHTLGPPWQRLDIPGLSQPEFSGLPLASHLPVIFHVPAGSVWSPRERCAPPADANRVSTEWPAGQRTAMHEQSGVGPFSGSVAVY